MRLGIYIPPFDELADPALVARLCAEAEEAGWDGAFVWDHVRWREPVRDVADPQITLAAIAGATERIRLGPMVTPLARRRPAKVARETATLDRLSDGRLTLGVGLGSDRFGGELSKTGEQLDDRRRGQMLDESLAILAAAWSGEPVHHRGEHYTVDDIAFLPRPVQEPGVPVWAAGFPGNVKPIRRAARLDGFFPANLEHPDQLAEVVATITDLRMGKTGAYDIAIGLPFDADPSRYNARLRAAADVRTGDRVLDIGCGTGQTTREAGRSARTGSALGVDLSGPMVGRARRLSEEEGIR